MPKKTEEARPFMCRNGHVLGHTEHDRSGMKLILYERSLDPRWPASQPEPIYRGTIRGPAVLRCTVCRVDEEWCLEREAKDRLLRNVKKYAGKQRTELPA